VKLRSRAALLAEFLAIFMAIPLALFLLPARIPPMPLLWLCCLYCLAALLRDPAFPRRALWNTAPFRGRLLSIAVLFAAAAVLCWLAIRHFAPQTLFDIPRAQPVLWAAIMVLYPVLSVYPQGTIYRVFVLHRYRPLLHGTSEKTQNAVLMLLSAASFSLMHIVFHNWIAVSLTFAGGLLFAWRQKTTGSSFVASFEHALYGCLLFTIGLGHYFYVRFV
jgi:hypothetical protein